MIRDPKALYSYRKDGSTTPYQHSGSGVPFSPRSWSGNLLVFKWILDVPSLADEEVCDFPAYAANVELKLGTPYLHLMKWANSVGDATSSLLLHRFYIASGTKVCGSSPLYGRFEGGLSVYDDGSTTGGPVFGVPISMNMTFSSSIQLAYDIPETGSSHSRACLDGGLGATNRNLLLFKLKNVTGSTTAAGKLALILEASEV